MAQDSRGFAAKTIKLLGSVAVAGAIALAGAPEVLAQCGAGPRTFASIGGGASAPKARVDTVDALNTGDEIGRFWDASNSDQGNNWGFTDPSNGGLVLSPNDDPRDPEGRCPSGNASVAPWWAVSQDPLRGFDGIVAVTSCEASTCPGADQIFLIEDFDTTTGAPGVDGTAYYIAARTDYDPGGTVGGRNWDLNKPLGDGVDDVVVPMVEFPTVLITNSTPIGNHVQLTLNFGIPSSPGNAATDPGDGVYANSPSGTSDSLIIESLDIYEHVGDSDPGRDRRSDCSGTSGCSEDYSCWTLGESYPYNDAPIGGVSYTVDCGDGTEDVWLAVGITFIGGANPVRSTLVGQAVRIECGAIAPPPATPEAVATCGAGPRTFASIGGGMAAPKARVDTVGALDTGDEIGRLWDAGNSDQGNNWGFTDPSNGSLVLSPNDDPRDPEGRCPSGNASVAPWWAVSQDTLRGFEGIVAVTSCETSTCPGADQIFLIEDFDTTTGAPGVGGTAYYIATRTDYDPAGTVGGRNWDLNKPLGNGVDGVVVPMVEFPTVLITASAAVGDQRMLTLDFGIPGAATDPGNGVYADSPSGTSDSLIIESLDIYEHVGDSDPGRDRRADCGGGDYSCWTLGQSSPYDDAPITGVSYTVNCCDPSADVWLAVGITFVGGSHPVRSTLVGPAVAIQCDPTIADPVKPIRPGARSRTLDWPESPAGGFGRRDD